MKKIYFFNVLASIIYGREYAEQTTENAPHSQGVFDRIGTSLRNHFVRNRKLSYCPLAIVFLCLNFNVVSAQDTEAKWHYLIEPYLMFPNMKGETAVAQLPSAEVAASAEDIFSNLKVGAMLYLEATNNNWTISIDFGQSKFVFDFRQNLRVKNTGVFAREPTIIRYNQ